MRLLNALWMSFYSRPLYREVFGHWKGVGFLHACLLALIQSIVATAQLDAFIDVVIRDYAPAVVQQMPAVTINNGLASTPEAKAYQIRVAPTGMLLAVIDTSLTEAPSDMGEIPLIMGQTGLIYKVNPHFAKTPGETRILPYKDFWAAPQKNQVTIDRPEIVSFLKSLSEWGALLFSPFMLFFQLLSMIFLVLFFSLFVWLSFRSASIQAPYSAILRLTAVSLSPATLLTLVLAVLLPTAAISAYLYPLLIMGYIFYALHAVKNPEESAKHNPEE